MSKSLKLLQKCFRPAYQITLIFVVEHHSNVYVNVFVLKNIVFRAFFCCISGLLNIISNTEYKDIIVYRGSIIRLI